MTFSGATTSPTVKVSTRSVRTTLPRTATWRFSMVMLSHIPKNPSMKAMAASMPTAGSNGMLW